jgi:hypothetical protein
MCSHIVDGNLDIERENLCGSLREVFGSILSMATAMHCFAKPCLV